MRERPPLEDIVGRHDPEFARLLTVHELLTAAGPPAELPPSLVGAPPEPRRDRRAFALPRRRFTALGSLAIAAVALFGAGYAIGSRNGPAHPVEAVALTGTPGARGTITVLARDGDGNTSLRLEVRGLPPRPADGAYMLWLTREGKLAQECGAFRVGEGTTKVQLNAPFDLTRFDGWAVVGSDAAAPLLSGGGTR